MASHAQLKIAPHEKDHHRGPLRSPVMLVQYGDFECPQCAQLAPAIELLLEDFELELAYVYRHFPLKKVHRQAEIAALAAEAADQQLQFWQMHHLIYANQEMLSLETVLLLAETLELDMDKFKSDLERKDLLARVREDFSGGVRSGVSSSPTLFLDGALFDLPPTYESIFRIIEEKRGFDRLPNLF